MQLVELVEHLFLGMSNSGRTSRCIRRTVHSVLVRKVEDNGTPVWWVSPTFTNTTTYTRCWLENGRCVSCTHSESNLVDYMRQHELRGGLVLVDYRPCQTCLNRLRQVGVRDIIYSEDSGYPWPRMLQKVHVPRLERRGLRYVRT